MNSSPHEHVQSQIIPDSVYRRYTVGGWKLWAWKIGRHTL